MYTPIQIGLPHAIKNLIEYKEFAPDKMNRNIVYCYWVLRSRQALEENMQYLVLPDGCIDIIFDVSPTPDSKGALIMSSDVTATTLTLGKSFSYIGIRMQLGVWLRMPVTKMGKSREYHTLGTLDLELLRQKLANNTQREAKRALESITVSLVKQSIVDKNTFIQTLLRHPMAKVEDIIQTSGYSRRQVQRLIHESVGYTPHEFLRIIRFQKALALMKADDYADQSHFIRDFKRITGLTPTEFKATYLF